MSIVHSTIIFYMYDSPVMRSDKLLYMTMINLQADVLL